MHDAPPRPEPVATQLQYHVLPLVVEEQHGVDSVRRSRAPNCPGQARSSPSRRKPSTSEMEEAQTPAATTLTGQIELDLEIVIEGNGEEIFLVCTRVVTA